MTTLFPQIKRVDEDETSKIIKNVLFNNQDTTKLEKILDEFMNLTEELSYSDDDDVSDSEGTNSNSEEEEEEEDDDDDGDSSDLSEVTPPRPPPQSWNLDQFIPTNNNHTQSQPESKQPPNSKSQPQPQARSQTQQPHPKQQLSTTHPRSPTPPRLVPISQSPTQLKSLTPSPPQPPTRAPLNHSSRIKLEPKYESRHESKHEPKHEPKYEPKYEPKHEPKHEPKYEPKHEPKHELRHEPKLELIHEPKYESRHELKHESKHKVKTEPEQESKLIQQRNTTPVTQTQSHSQTNNHVNQNHQNSCIVQIDLSKLKRIPTIKAPTPTMTGSKHIQTAKALKHEADVEKDKTKQAIKYLDACMHFTLHGQLLEKEKRDYSYYSDIIPLFKHVRNLSAACSPDNPDSMTNLKINALTQKCLGILHTKLYRLRERDLVELAKLTNSHQNGSPIQQADELLIGVKPTVLSAYKRQMAIYEHLKNAHDNWHKAEHLCDQNPALKIFFSTIESNCGPLTMITPFSKLMDHVQCGLKLLRTS